MKRSIHSLILCCVTVLLATGCAIPSVDVAPRYGIMNLDGTYGLENADSAGDPTVAPADLSTAGLDTDNGYIGAKIELDLGVPVFTLSTQSTKHGGDGTLSATVGAIFVTSPVATNLDLGLHTLLLTWDVVPTDYVDIGIGLGATVIDLDASIAGAGEEETADETIPVPVLGIRARVELGDFRFSALLSGMSLDLGSDKANFYDIDVLAEYHLFGGDDRLGGSIGLGYRSTVLDFEYEDGGDSIDVEVDLNGPYVAMVFSF